MATLTIDFEDDQHVPVTGHTIKSGGPRPRFAYEVKLSRKVRSDIHPHRYRLDCVRLPSDTVPDPDFVFWWYKRKRRK